MSEESVEQFERGDLIYIVQGTWNQHDEELPEHRRRPNVHTVVKQLVSEVLHDYIITRDRHAEYDLNYADHKTNAWHPSICFKEESEAQYHADRLNEFYKIG